MSVTGAEPVLAAVRSRLPPGYKPTSEQAERGWEVDGLSGLWHWRSDEGAWFPASDPVLAAEFMLSDLELWVAEHARRHIFVHAGCVVVEGSAIVLPGRSMSGKSSLTAALVQAGADYYSDEYAVVDAKGWVRPYPRRLSLRRPDGSKPERRSAEELGGRVGRGPARIGLIAVLRFDPAEGWSTETLSRGQAVLGLLDNTVPAQSRPRASLAALANATESAVAVAGTRDDAEETARRLLDLHARAVQEPGPGMGGEA